MRKSLLALITLFLAAPLLAALPEGWVGRETCATCHEDAAKAFVNGPHGRAMAQRAATPRRRGVWPCGHQAT
jgi:hypothetical protein